MRLAFSFLAMLLGYTTAALFNPVAVSFFIAQTRWDNIVAYLHICLFWAAWALAFRAVAAFYTLAIGKITANSLNKGSL